VQQEQLEQASPISFQELKELSASQGPCITVLFPLHHEDTRQIRVTVKKALQDISEKLDRRNVDRKSQAALLEPIRALADTIEEQPQAHGVLILRSPDVFRHYFIPQAPQECVEVAEHFYLLPLIPILRESRPFYILALSQKHIRLLRCTNMTSEEVPLPPTVPQNLDAFIHSDKPDHVLDNSAAGGPGTGTMGRVMFGTGTDKERSDQYLLHFYKAVDRGIGELLKDDPSPVVIAGVEYELPLYRNVSTFPRLVEDPIRGAPDGLKGGELHKRAFDPIQTYWRKDIEEALEMYEQLGGSDRVSVSLKEIVKAAYDGRVLHLFVAQGARHLGNFDEMSHRVRTHSEERPGDEDLINAATVQTISHAGNVFVIPRNKVPHGSQMAAVMRY
jgi:hypothetical protein